MQTRTNLFLWREEWRSANKRFFVEDVLTLLEISESYETLPFIVAEILHAHWSIPDQWRIVGLQSAIELRQLTLSAEENIVHSMHVEQRLRF